MGLLTVFYYKHVLLSRKEMLIYT